MAMEAAILRLIILANMLLLSFSILRKIMERCLIDGRKPYSFDLTISLL